MDELILSLVQNDISNYDSQQALEDLYYTLDKLGVQPKRHGIPRKRSMQERAIKQSGEIELLLDSIHIILPVSAMVPVLTTAIKEWSDLRKKRTEAQMKQMLKFKGKNGEEIIISGHSADFEKLRRFINDVYMPNNQNTQDDKS
jgi:hypothetical protein